MAMEWAHALATANDAETKRRLDNVVLLLVPSLNPDGETMITDYYRKFLGTRYEGGRLPWLYHHYVGHDNNRDWFMLTQVETKALSRAVYHEWYPQVWVDEHQMGTDGPRMFIPPFADPVDPDVHPLIWREANLVGTNMAFRLEQQEKAGLIYGYSFDAYWLGGTRNTGWWKNITGLLLETASARIASPIVIDPSELRGGQKGLIEYKATVNHPHPWTGGTWRMRDIMDYERIASDALLETAADRREDLLRDVAVRAQAAVAFGGAKAYRIPHDQHDWPTAQFLAALMLEHGVEIQQADNGDYWIPMAQPYSKFLVEMLEPQRYPEVRLQPGKDILRPYDVATWTLPLAMGVTVEKTTMPAKTSYKPVTEIKPETKEVLRKHAVAAEAAHRHLQPVGRRARRRMDALAARPVRLRAEVAPSAGSESRPAELRRLHPSRHRQRGDRHRPPRGRRRVDEVRRRAAAGVSRRARKRRRAGAEDLRRKRRDAARLQRRLRLRHRQLQHPRPQRAGESRPTSPSPARSSASTSATIIPSPPGMPEETAIFIDHPIAFETTAPGNEMQRWVLATYPDDARDILLSGWIAGEEKLTRKAAAVAMTYGKGRIVLLGFRPQHRGQTHATFPMIFNALYWGRE